MSARCFFVAAIAVALAGCGESGKTAGEDRTPGVTPNEPLPPSDLGNVYPSQAGETAPVTPGAQGGRSSAATGATDQGLQDLPAGEAGPESQQRRGE